MRNLACLLPAGLKDSVQNRDLLDTNQLLTERLSARLRNHLRDLKVVTDISYNLEVDFQNFTQTYGKRLHRQRSEKYCGIF